MRARPVAFVAAAIGLLGIIWAVSGCGSLPENAAARVNGEVITKDAVNDRIERLRKNFGPMVPEESEGDFFTNFRRETTDQLVRLELQRQEAEKRGISVTREEVDQRFQDVADESFLGDVGKLKESYFEKGLSEEDLYNDISVQIEREKLEADIGKDIQVTEEDARAYYDRNIGQYAQPERRQVRRIVTESQSKAEEAVRRARAGESFITLVDQLSVAEDAKTKKGALGIITAGQIAPELEKAVFTLEANAISEPVKLGELWYVFMAEAIFEPFEQPFEEVKNDIIILYGNQQFAEKWRTYAQDVYDEADLDFAEEYDPEKKVEIEQEQPQQ